MSETSVLNRDHAAALVGTLFAAGLRHAIVSPGSRNTPIVLALHALAQAEPSLHLHSVLDERSAAFLALGLARASGHPSLLACTSGSAGAHYLPAIIEAYHAHIPLIVLTADRPPELQDRGAPQTIDQTSLFGVHTRKTFCLAPPSSDGETVRATALRAFQAATGACPGPVHINVQLRKPLWHPESPAVVDVPRLALHRPDPPQLGPAELEDLLARCRSARRGLFVWGPDPDPALQADAVLALAVHLGWPVLADPSSPARFRGDQHTQVMVAHDTYLRSDHIAEALAPDLVIQLGGTPSSAALRALVGAAPDVIAIDPRGVWRDPEHSLRTLLAVQPAPVARALKQSLPAAAQSDWMQAWRAHEDHARVALSHSCGQGWWAGSIVQGLLSGLPAGALLNVASSMAIRDLDSFGLPGTHPIQIMSNRGVNGIDGTIATTLGLAMAWAEGPTAALMGDLAFLHDQGSLMLCRSIQTPVVVLVVDNSGGGIFAHLPIAAHPDAFEPWFLTPQQADIPALCAAHALPCSRISSRSELQRALASALQHPGLSILHLTVDRDDDLAQHTAAWSEAQQT